MLAWVKANTETLFVTDPPVVLLKDLTVRPLKDEEYSRASELLEQEHYLGDCPERTPTPKMLNSVLAENDTFFQVL